MSSNTPPDIKLTAKHKAGVFNQHNRRKSFGKKNPSGYINRSTFKGDTEGLEGHIYNVGVKNQAELFANTTKKIFSYSGRNYNESQDIRIALETIAEVTIPVPAKEETGDDEIETLILKR